MIHLKGHIERFDMMVKKVMLTLVLCALIAGSILFAVNRGASEDQQDGRVQVVASFYPLYDFARQVGGNKVTVTNLTPAGAEPHDYEPSAKSLADAQQADVFVYNGGNLEPWTDGFVSSYKHTAVKASQHIALRADADPHFWLDPVLATQIVNNIRDGLSKADSAHADYYAKNAADYRATLAQLDADFASGLHTCKQRTIITSHDAFGYLAMRYNFTVEAIAGISPDEEPSPSRLAALSNLVRTSGIDYVFFESLVSPRLADTIAQEAGAKTLVLDPIEGLPNEDQKQGKNYVSVQRENLVSLRTALACD